MARPMNPETGKPWPRQRPINWNEVRRVLQWRQADKRLKDAGFMRVRAFASLPWESPDLSHRIIDTAVHPNGMGLYVKLALRTPAPDA